MLLVALGLRGKSAAFPFDGAKGVLLPRLRVDVCNLLSAMRAKTKSVEAFLIGLRSAGHYPSRFKMSSADHSRLARMERAFFACCAKWLAMWLTWLA